MIYNLLIVGVGGQGIILVSEVIARAALAAGLYVKKSETHGMAQRGGSVVTHSRISDAEVFSPLIPKGAADMLLAFEPVEALRYADYLGKDAKIIVNTNPIAVGNYPEMEKVLEELKKLGNVTFVDAAKLAMEAGNPMTQNTVMLGAASKNLPVKKEVLLQSIRENVKKSPEENLKAFELGAKL
jgi:indolepyruvate ferredoxin oxidoreductase beta subunit